MIYPDDSKAFSEIMDVTWQSLSRSTLPDKNVKKYWFGKLQKYALGDVAGAFDTYIDKAPRATNGTFILPSVKDIESICKPKPDQFALPKPSPLTTDEQRANAQKVKQMVATQLKPKTNYHSWFIRILKRPKDFPEESVEKAINAARSFGYDLNTLEVKA